jgi:hypothetical protein
LRVDDKERKGDAMSRAGINALKAGLAGSAVTAGTLLGMSASIAWPASNLSGYIVAGKILGAGAATSAKVAAVGGPLAAGGIAIAGIGLAAAGIAYSVFKLLEK